MELHEHEWYYNVAASQLRLDQFGSLQRLVLNVGEAQDGMSYFHYQMIHVTIMDIVVLIVFVEIGIPYVSQGFTPRFQEEWELSNGTSGCMRWTPLDCHSGEGCLLLVGVKLPDMLEFSLNECMNLKECRALFTRLQFVMYSKQEGVCFDIQLIITKMHVQYDQIQGSFSGQEIEVKRVSQPCQGLEEFKNVVVLIAKLQHRNLVSLLGCCIHGDEYDTRSALLGWDTRFNIIMGITRGLIGYMSPEYAVYGKFSVKSDVFGFGVLLLEIGNINRRFSHLDHNHNLVGHAWLLWNEEKSLEILHKYLEESCIESQDIRLHLEKKVIKRMNFGVIPIERCS
ncbi:hypothetical protein ACFX1Z_007613 [Malus domestica]